MNRRAVLYLFIISLLAGCVAEHPEAESKAQAMQTQQPAQPPAMHTQPQQNASNLSQQVLSIAGVEKGEVEMLTPENLSRLAEKYPVIYGNLPSKTLYQIKTEDMLIIVDAEQKKVLRKFRVVGVKLGG